MILNCRQGLGCKAKNQGGIRKEVGEGGLEVHVVRRCVSSVEVRGRAVLDGARATRGSQSRTKACRPATASEQIVAT